MKYSNTFVAGIDVSDKKSAICILDRNRTVVLTDTVGSDRDSFTEFFQKWGKMTIALEVGTQSFWMSQLLRKLGHDVIVANAHKVHLISRTNKKSDRIDAEILARLALADPALLYPIQHRQEISHNTRVLVSARRSLVETRESLINKMRGTLKAVGERFPSCSTHTFHKHRNCIPEHLSDGLSCIMDTIEQITKKISELDIKIKDATDNNPHVQRLMSIPGVGPITALYFYATIEDPFRYSNTKHIASYLGLCPALDQSGESNPGLRITRAGDTYMRKLLINCAQHILGHFGRESCLRTKGLTLVERGGHFAKKKAVVAIARKLAVTMLSIWKSGETFEPAGKMVQYKGRKRKHRNRRTFIKGLVSKVQHVNNVI